MRGFLAFGVSNKNLPNGKKKPLFKQFKYKNSSYYKYTYIGDDTNYFYLPISGGFDGVDFYSNNTLKPPSDLLSIDNHFTSNILSIVDYPTAALVNSYTPRVDDGSFFLKIYDSTRLLMLN